MLIKKMFSVLFFFFSSRRRHTRSKRDWSSDVCSSDLTPDFMRAIHSIEIRDDAHVGTARRVVHRFASDLGFDENKLAEIDIVVQEIGTNAVRYAATGGWLHYRTPQAHARVLELFYWDTGPGISVLGRA